MRNLLAVLFPAATLALAGCAATPRSPEAKGLNAVERNKPLVRELTDVIWNRLRAARSSTAERTMPDQRGRSCSSASGLGYTCTAAEAAVASEQLPREEFERQGKHNNTSGDEGQELPE